VDKEDERQRAVETGCLGGQGSHPGGRKEECPRKEQNSKYFSSTALKFEYAKKKKTEKLF
jgi:hypothetical protein